MIETIDSDGMYGNIFDTTSEWYNWVGGYKTGQYVPVETPEKFLRIVGFWEMGPSRNTSLELLIDNYNDK